MATFARDAVNLYYERHGDDAAGDPLLCIMGLGGTIDFWEFQTPALSRVHPLLIYDNRGVGRSDKPAGPYTVQAMADDAVALLDERGWDRVHVLGLSMGGMIAQDVALRYPDRVGALLLAATYARPDQNVRANAGSAPDPAALDVKQIFRLITAMVLTPEFIAREKVWLRALRDKLMAHMTVEGFVAQLAATMAHDAAGELGRIAAPTLVMMPTADQLIPPRCSEELASLIPGAVLQKFEGGSHGFNVEQADKFNQAVLDFVARHPLAEMSRF